MDFESLPAELLVHALSFLPLSSVPAAARISRLFRECCNDPTLWLAFYRRDVAIDLPKSRDPKEAYRAALNWKARVINGDFERSNVYLSSRAPIVRTSLAGSIYDEMSCLSRPLLSYEDDLEIAFCGRHELFANTLDLTFWLGGRVERLRLKPEGKGEIQSFCQAPSAHFGKIYIVTWTAGPIEFYQMAGKNQRISTHIPTKSEPCPCFPISVNGRNFVALDDEGLQIYSIDERKKPLLKRAVCRLGGIYFRMHKLLPCQRGNQSYLVGLDASGRLTCWPFVVSPDCEEVAPLWQVTSDCPSGKLADLMAALHIVADADGDLLLAYNAQKRLVLLDPVTHEEKLVVSKSRENKEPLRKLEIIRDRLGKAYAIALQKNRIQIWSLVTGEFHWSLTEEGMDHFVIVRGPGGPFLFTTGRPPYPPFSDNDSKDLLVKRWSLFARNRLKPTLIGELTENWSSGRPTNEQWSGQEAHSALLLRFPADLGFDSLILMHLDEFERTFRAQQGDPLSTHGSLLLWDLSARHRPIGEVTRDALRNAATAAVRLVKRSAQASQST